MHGLHLDVDMDVFVGLVPCIWLGVVAMAGYRVRASGLEPLEEWHG